MHRPATRLAVIAGIALSLTAAPVFASTFKIGNYGQFHFADYDDFDTGFGLAGSYMFTPEIRGFAEFTGVDNSDFELDRFVLGGGYTLIEQDIFQLELGGSFQNWDVTQPVPGTGDTTSEDDNALGVFANTQFEVTREVVLGARAEYINFDDFGSDFGIGGNADIQVTDELSLFADVMFWRDDIDQTFLTLGARYNF